MKYFDISFQIMIIALVLVPFSAHSDSKAYESAQPEFSKMVSVIKKDGRCALAAVEQARPNAPKVVKDIAKSQIHSFYCIGDIVLDAGTLKEKKGCGAFILDGNNLNTQPLVDRFGYNLAEKSCNDGGFETILKDEVMGDIHVSDKLTDTSDYPTEKILLYSENTKFLEWYKKAKIQQEVQTISAFEKRKRSEGYPRYNSGYDDSAGTPYKEIVSGEPLIDSEGKATIERVIASENEKAKALVAKSKSNSAKKKIQESKKEKQSIHNGAENE